MTQPRADDEEIHTAGPAIVRDERTGREYVSPYRYQRQFEALFDEKAQFLQPRFARPAERFAWVLSLLPFVAFALLAPVFTRVLRAALTNANNKVAVLIGVCVIFGIVGVGLGFTTRWGFAGLRRFRLRLIEERLCFDCGYALIGAPTDDLGRGRCPECGKAFRVATYLRPPKRYHRAGPAPPPARESGHVLRP